MTTWTMETAPAFARELLRVHHRLVASVAREHVASEGRGLVSVTWRGDPPVDVPTIGELRIGDWTMTAYRQRTAGHRTGMIREMADDLLHRMATYDPRIDMVVSVVVGPEFLTTPWTLALEPPVILDEAAGVH